MPSKPPSLRPAAKRKAWQRAAQAPDVRIRGRRGVELRKQRLAAEPLCRHCLDRGIVTPATTPDHIVALAFGGTEDEANIQCLCADCHALKTAMEAKAAGPASNHPEWLRPSAVPLTIVCGPPCAGKTTFVAEAAHPHDVVICLDSILTHLRPGHRHWTGALDRDLLNRAVRVRNELLGSLSRMREGTRAAWFIVSAPTQAERDWWQAKLGGEVVLLHPGAAECKRRAVKRGTPRAIEGIDAWERAARGGWLLPVNSNRVR